MHWNETSTSRHCPQTCGYNLKKDVVFLPISALTAANIVKPYEVCPFALGIAGLCSFTCLIYQFRALRVERRGPWCHLPMQP